jgi:hypothetical protein
MAESRISLDVFNASQSHNIAIELHLDQTKFFDHQISPGTHHVVYEFDGDAAKHCFSIVMKGKTHSDTQIDQQGHIIQDAIISIKNLAVDHVNIDQLAWNLAQYTHDGNGTEPAQTQHRFYGDLGCNGRVQLEFSCPIYLWSLQNQ